MYQWFPKVSVAKQNVYITQFLTNVLSLVFILFHMVRFTDKLIGGNSKASFLLRSGFMTYKPEQSR